jgi:exonuclease VII large subunit
MQPDVQELVSLIQELNQCNSALLDRVTQLEEALEPAQGDRPMAPPSQAVTAANTEATTPSAEQVAQVFQELENAHQTTQRQQVLIETLTEQFNQSQQRLTHLETEYARLQQQHQEQTQQLQARAATCQDLQMRLQRQQRYTLQFKAALERCLEVSTPPDAAPLLLDQRVTLGTPELDPASVPDQGAIAAFAAPPPAPKVSQIQPWSAQTVPSGLPAKLDHLLGASLPSESTASEHTPAAAAAPAPITPFNAAPPPPSHLAPAESAQENWQHDPDVQASSNALQAAAMEFRALITNLLSSDADTPAAAATSPSSETPPPVPSEVATAQPATINADQLTPATPPPATPAKPRLSMPKEIFQQAANMAQAAETAQSDSQTHTGSAPAPRVYPFRPLKKIESVAAVDLPTFPHTT